MSASTACIDKVFRSMGAGDVSDPVSMGAHIEALMIITAMGIAVVVVHHEIKSGGTYAGSVALGDASDTIVRTETVERSRKSFAIGAAKDDAEADPRAFDLEPTPVGSIYAAG